MGISISGHIKIQKHFLGDYTPTTFGKGEKKFPRIKDLNQRDG